MKESYYFSHDYNARSDPKIKKLLLKYGMQGYGIFWSIVEDLYTNTNVLPTQYDVIAFDLRCDEATVKSIINDFGLFEINGETFGSASVKRRLSERDEKSRKARESVLRRWNKNKNDTNVSQNDTNVLPTQYECNTIKERKEYNKETTTNVVVKKVAANAATLLRKKDFYNSLKPFLEEYTPEMIRAFSDYWSEMNKSHTKMRFEQQPTWEISKRLATWALRDKNYGNGTNKQFDKKAANNYALEQFRTLYEQQKVLDEVEKPF